MSPYLPTLHDMALFFSGVIFMFVFNIVTKRSTMQAILQQFLIQLEQIAFATALQFAQQKVDQVNQAIINGTNKAAQKVHDDFVALPAPETTATTTTSEAPAA